MYSNFVSSLFYSLKDGADWDPCSLKKIMFKVTSINLSWPGEKWCVSYVFCFVLCVENSNWFSTDFRFHQSHYIYWASFTWSVSEWTSHFSFYILLLLLSLLLVLMMMLEWCLSLLFYSFYFHEHLCVSFLFFFFFKGSQLDKHQLLWLTSHEYALLSWIPCKMLMHLWEINLIWFDLILMLSSLMPSDAEISGALSFKMFFGTQSPILQKMIKISLFSTKYFSTLFSHRHNLDLFYYMKWVKKSVRIAFTSLRGPYVPIFFCKYTLIFSVFFLFPEASVLISWSN